MIRLDASDSSKPSVAHLDWSPVVLLAEYVAGSRAVSLRAPPASSSRSSRIVAALGTRTSTLSKSPGPAWLLGSDQLNRVLRAIAVTLVALAAVNAISIAWATASGARHSSALARTLGATPRDVSAALSAAQLLPALAGAVLGIPGASPCWPP